MLTTNSPLVSSLPCDVCCVTRLSRGEGLERSAHSISVIDWMWRTSETQTGIGSCSLSVKHAGRLVQFWLVNGPYTGTFLQELLGKVLGGDLYF